MYQIVVVQPDGQEHVVARSGYAGAALKQFRASQNRFSRIIVRAPTGQEISGFELGRRYDGEERSRYA